MMSLKPTSIVTAFIVQGFIVFTIINSVFSDNKVERCTKAINHLYLHRAATQDGFEGIGSTDFDESINNDALKMFIKGFFVFNKAEIHKINIHLPDLFPITSNSEELKERIVAMLEHSHDFIQSISGSGEFKDLCIQMHENFVTRYLEASPSDIKGLQQLIGKMELFFATRDGRSPVQSSEVTNPEIEEIDVYTYNYFIKFLDWVSINEKDSLRNPAQFCSARYEANLQSVGLCKEIVYRKFNLNETHTGSQIFDLFYTYWTLNEVEATFAIKEERINIRTKLSTYKDKRALDEAILRYETDKRIYKESLISFYQQFKNIIYFADASRVLPPEAYCTGIFGEASSS